jgi:hypothetical protein
MSVKFIYDDGGRSKYFKADKVGDCVTRAIAIATGKDYKEIYEALYQFNGETPRNGVRKKDTRKFIENYLGWKWVPLMGIGTGCRVHLRADELAKQGTIILKLSKHLATVKDGILYDTYDCSRSGTRCVYGYWIK